ncbi:2-amino-4-hydroxy-6-hydroxymethyldihydropteridine diphosphokinase [Pedobacter steynii]
MLLTLTVLSPSRDETTPTIITTNNRVKRTSEMITPTMVAKTYLKNSLMWWLNIYFVNISKKIASGFYMMFDTKKVYLLLGSNLGDRKQLIDDAMAQIALDIGEVFVRSSVYETEAWGKEDQPSFLNVALGVSTKLTPVEVLDRALEIELELGRVRHEKWGSRLIDIDVIFYDNIVVDMKDKLQIPHPQMQYRKFVLEPLAEIAPDYVHPILKITVKQVLERLHDNLSVSRI